MLGAGKPPPIGTEKQTIAQVIDRWIYVIMAAWFVVTALVGFIPTSIGKSMAVQQGFLPPFPVVLHVHAALMGSWLVLLLTQTILMATGRRSFHIQLGIAGAVLAPAMVVTGICLVPAMFLRNWAVMQGAPPEMLPGGSLDAGQNFLSSIVAAQTSAGLLFAVFVAWALLVRRRDAGMHKRLIILATAIPLAAAIDRIWLLPTSYPESGLSPILYPVVWILPMLVWDIARLRQVHRAYLAWFALYIPAGCIVYSLWWSPGWIETVQRMMGVA
jgi:hypothetical protein